MTGPDLGSAALAYAAEGLYVFPLKPGTKVPDTAHGFKDATRDEAQIKAWWQQEPERNIGLACGMGGLMVPDLDVKHRAEGVDGIARWTELAALHGAPATRRVRTPSGGEHLLFVTDEHLPILRKWGIDFQGPGTYVVAAPSRGIIEPGYPHTDYEIVDNLPIARLPRWVAELVREHAGAQREPRVDQQAANSGDPFASPAGWSSAPAAGETEVRLRVQELALRIARAEHGKGNPTIAQVAFWAGEYVANGQINGRWVLETLTGALADWTWHAGHQNDRAATEATIKRRLMDGYHAPHPRAWKAGEADPQEAPAGDEPAGASAMDERERKILERLEWMEVDREARIRISASARPEPPATISLTNALTVEFPDLEWAVEGLMHRDGICLFSAPQKAGKTVTVGNLVRSLADGDKFLDCFLVPEPLKVGVLDTESGERQLYDWLRRQRIQRTDNVRVTSLYGLEASLNPMDPQCRDMWLPALEGLDVAILDVVGPMIATLGMSEDDNPEVSRYWIAWRTLLAEAGVRAGLVVHHTGHNEGRPTGASSWLRYPKSVWKLEREDEDPTSARYFSAYGRDVLVHRGALEYDSITNRLAYTSKSKAAAIASRHVPALVELLRRHGPSNQRRCVELLTGAVDGLSRDRARQVPEQGVRDRVLRMWRDGKSEVYGLAAEHGFKIE